LRVPVDSGVVHEYVEFPARQFADALAERDDALLLEQVALDVRRVGAGLGKQSECRVDRLEVDEEEASALRWKRAAIDWPIPAALPVITTVWPWNFIDISCGWVLVVLVDCERRGYQGTRSYGWRMPATFIRRR
jgi:hypothetical protein